MSDFDRLRSQFDSLKDLASRPDGAELLNAVEKVEGALKGAYPKWITLSGLVKRTGADEFAARVAAKSLVKRGVARSGKSKSGEVVYRMV